MLTYRPELELMEKGYPVIAGIDEVGRGPWAGPVMAAAAILNPDDIPEGLMDSKKLTKKRRIELNADLQARAHVALGEASVEEIDQLNILQATYVAMARAVESLPIKPDYLLVDGNRWPGTLTLPGRCVIKGDGKILSIAAASIVAKVVRDDYMATLHEIFPHYGWHSNAGYGTKDHQNGLAGFGITPHHRRSFKPIRAYLNQSA